MNQALPSTSPARQPELLAGWVHVWRADLDLPSPLDVLSLAEHERRAHIRDERRRRRSLAARGILRTLLGGYLQRDPRSLELVAGAHGKPLLAGASGRQLHFNLAHSGELALLAFSRDCAVGVDVERGERVRDVMGVARRLLGDGAERLLELDESARRRELLRAWVRAEAIMKCDGRGLRVCAEDVTDGVVAIELDAVTEAAAALALARRERPRMRLLRWPPAG